MTYTCTRCGDTFTRTLPKTVHSYTDRVIDPTCTEKGYTVHTCTQCGDTYSDSETAALGHNYISRVTTQPTCAKEGVETFTCTRCGDTYTRPVAKTLHTYTDTVVEPDCTRTGYTEHTCTVCGSSYRSDYVPPIGHKYEVTTTAPTYDSEGYDEHICSVCGDSYRDNIKPKLIRTNLSESSVQLLIDESKSLEELTENDITVIVDGNTLTLGEDYTVTLEKDPENGTVKVKITGIGDYEGELEETFEFKKPQFDYIKGDINRDGKVDTKDAMLAVAFAKKTQDPKDDYQQMAADVNGDGRIDSRDALIIVNAVKYKKTIV